jgi:light-independent protochlorophyllide reductase subunit B
MQLTLWTYEGPTHVGAMRIASSMRDVHYVLHAPQGDTYADLLFTMIQRDLKRPPVTYTTFQARDLGGDTAELFKNSVRASYERFKPAAMLVGSSCTAELIQDDPAGLSEALNLPIPVVPLELPSYQRKENWGASETFYRITRALVKPRDADQVIAQTTCNILGPSSLGFRNRDDLQEIKQLLESIGVQVNVVAPLNASPDDLSRLSQAHFNVVLYREIGQSTADFLQRQFKQPFTTTVPIGLKGTLAFIDEVAELAGLDPVKARAAAQNSSNNRSRWYSESVDATYLTGKRVFIFGDATHVIGAAQVASRELGFEVVGLGTYSREFARDIRQLAQSYGVEALITDDYLDVEEQVQALHPELVLGTQMERHMAKRLGVPCAVISAPVHVQDFPARYSPQMGFEGANVLFDTWVHPLMMGLEEHLLHMFRDDFEFNDGAGASHLGKSSSAAQASVAINTSEQSTDAAADQIEVQHTELATVQIQALDSNAVDLKAADANTSTVAVTKTEAANEARWSAEAEAELKKIPFFVRGKARRNTETFARQNGISIIEIGTLYDAKAHFSR